MPGGEPIIRARHLTNERSDLPRRPLLRGRDFGEQDGGGAPEVAIVNEPPGGRLWLGEDPVGRRLRVFDRGGNPRGSEIVGVVADIKYRRLGEPPC